MRAFRTIFCFRDTDEKSFSRFVCSNQVMTHDNDALTDHWQKGLAYRNYGIDDNLHWTDIHSREISDIRCLCSSNFSVTIVNFDLTFFDLSSLDIRPKKASDIHSAQFFVNSTNEARVRLEMFLHYINTKTYEPQLQAARFAALEAGNCLLFHISACLPKQMGNKHFT